MCSSDLEPIDGVAAECSGRERNKVQHNQVYRISGGTRLRQLRPLIPIRTRVKGRRIKRRRRDALQTSLLRDESVFAHDLSASRHSAEQYDFPPRCTASRLGKYVPQCAQRSIGSPTAAGVRPFCVRRSSSSSSRSLMVSSDRRRLIDQATAMTMNMPRKKRMRLIERPQNTSRTKL